MFITNRIESLSKSKQSNSLWQLPSFLQNLEKREEEEEKILINYPTFLNNLKIFSVLIYKNQKT